MITKSRYATHLAAGMVAALALTGIGASAATAADELANESVVEVPMTVIAFDREIAAANGYEIRTDDRGYEYSVPVGTPADAPVTGPLVPGDDAAVQARGTSVGNCGSSYVDVRYGTMFTGYNINTANGKPISHSWYVTVTKTSLSYAPDLFVLGGLAPLGSSSWSTSRALGPGTPGQAVAEGSVITSNGSLCFSGAPAWP